MQPGGDYGSKRGSALRCGGGVVARSDRTDGFGQVFARAVQGLAESVALRRQLLKPAAAGWAGSGCGPLGRAGGLLGRVVGPVFARAGKGLAESFALLTPAPPCQQYSSIAD